ncbi:hypothetical protein [Rhizobium sp. RU20A]|nr:hypothetical protein [Rhizobium sp. RU20A]
MKSVNFVAVRANGLKIATKEPNLGLTRRKGDDLDGEPVARLVRE